MSLNGLDGPAIAEAAQALQTDASAWLLLKYATRDEVELFASGKGGVSEAASKINEYEDKSPLYGLAGNNGKKILIKYVPEGTSRLLQARVKVHFESLETHFAHDSELSISTAQELAETAGTTPAPSALTPDASAPPIQKPPAPVAPVATVTSGAQPNRTPSAAERVSHESEQLGAIKEEEEVRVPSSRTARLLADVRAGKLESHEVLAALKITHTLDSDKASSTNSQEWPERSSSLNNDKAKLSSSTGPPEDLLEQFPSPRQSFSSNVESNPYKQKVKLGPRPTQLSETNPSNISSLPANISVPVRSPQSPAFPPPARPSSSQTANVPFRLGENSSFPIVQTPASVVGAGYLEKDRPKSRAGSVVTLPASYSSPQEGLRSPKSPKDIPQEKIRLMKALELRRKQQARDRKAQEASSAEPSPKIPSSMASPTSTESAQPLAGASAAAISQSAAVSGLGIGIEDKPSNISPDTGVGVADKSVSAPAAARKEPASADGEDGGRKGAQMSNGATGNLQAATVAVEPQLPNVPEAQELRLEQKNTEQVQSSTPAVEKEESSIETRSRDQPTAQSAARDFATGESQAVSTANVPQPSTNNNELDPGAEKSLQQAGHGEGQAADQSSVGSPVTIRDSVLYQSRPHLHTKDVSISTSLSSASFLDELDGTTVQEAQPVTFVKSPVTPTYQKSFEFDAKQLSGSQATAPEQEQKQEQQPKTDDAKQEPVSSTVAAPVADSEPADTTTPTTTIETQKNPEVLRDEAAPIQQESTNFEAPKVPEVPAPSNLQPVPESEEETPAQAEHSPSKADSDHTVKAEKAEASKEREAFPSESAVTSPSASEDRSSAIEESSPISTSRGGSPPTKKHPTVNAPHIWGGPLRAASNASGAGPSRHLSPAPDLQRLNRSASIASNNSNMGRPDSPSGVKKTGVGSRIADRIKALEKSSGGAQSSSGGFMAPSSVSVSSRKSSFNTPPGSSGVDAMRKAPGPYPTPSPSPGSNIFARRFASVRGPASESAFTDNTVRPTQLHGHSASSELQRPTARPTYLRQQSSDRDSRGSSESAKKAENKPPSREGALSPSQKRGSFGSHRLSFSGKRESTDTVRTGHSRQSSVESTGTNSEKNKDNKAKKLLKRMTGAFSPRKDKHGGANLSSEPIMEGVEQDSPTERLHPTDARVGAVSRGDSSRPQSKWNSSVVVGEVNIQFPDTLLWKRRHMELDGDGYMILLPTTSDRSSRVASKRYHMSEFYAPYIPDQEREELPYSVILDFMDSSTLQCACQNTTDQTNVLQALSSVHAAFAESSRR